MPGAMDLPASSEAPSQPSKLQQFRRVRRRKRFEKLPQTVGLGAVMFASLAALQGTTGVFDGWRDAKPRYNEAQQARLALSEWTADAAGWYTQTGSSDRYPGPEAARRLTSVNVNRFGGSAGAGGNGTCAPPGNSSSVLPALPFEDARAEAFIFCAIITLYMFLGLAIVCDSFFEASLSAICEAMNLKDDVAGATWMAAGGSAPELATSIIGVFFSQSDVGFGTIVGSAVFNVLFVIACCAFVAPNLKLSWWPLARDASYYCFSLAMIVVFVTDLEIHVWEAAILLLMYVGYVMVMYYNERLEVWVTKRIEINAQKGGMLQELLKKIIENPIFAALLYALIVANTVLVIMEMNEFNQAALQLPCICGVNVGASALQVTRSSLETVNLVFNVFFICEMAVKLYAYGFFGYWRVPLNCFDGSLVFLIVVELILTESARGTAAKMLSSSTAVEDQDADDSIGVGVARVFRLLKFVRLMRTGRVLRLLRVGGMGKASVVPDATEDGTKSRQDPAAEKEGKEVEGGTEPDAGEGDDDDDDDDDGPFNPFEMWGGFDSPGAIFGRTMWFVGLPLSVAFWLTIPDCRRPMFAKAWIGTFLGCIFWIAVLATIMVWMVERIGEMYNVPSSIMGLFVLAAGTSIPDCLSSVAVARRGHGDMAVSSSIGSNIFDVLIGLPIPWFIYTAILVPVANDGRPSYVPVQSASLAVMILMLFVMVALVITTVHLSGWILSVKLGLCMMALYFLFLVLALLLDPISGPVIFPDCIPGQYGLIGGR